MKYSVPSIDEVKLAFSKLQSYNYFDNYDLILREKIARYKLKSLESNFSSFRREFEKLRPFQKDLKVVNLITLPKKVQSEPGLPNNFYTNSRVIDGNKIEKALIYCDVSVHLHLIATIWVLRYGTYIEDLLSNSAFGNRLLLDRRTDKIVEGRTLFKRYIGQFQNWWSQAIENAKKLIKDGKNVTIVNFDLQSFYHRVEFDFTELEEILQDQFPNIKKDPIHLILIQLHNSYREKINLIKRHKKTIKVNDKYPLPIGVFTSQIFANWYLSKLDRFIEKEIDHVYYGRYVDDFLLVVEDTVLTKDDVGAVGELKDFVIKKYLMRYFGTLFTFDAENSSNTEFFSLKVPGLENLVLNPDKLFVYQFHAGFSPNIIDTFVEEQEERASMFRFLSDEEDEYFGDFDAQTFESNFDHIDGNKARFKNVEDNKYKLSVFFSKLIKRRVQKGSGYREEDVDKISRYFKSVYLIKNYQFWEKLFTLFVVYQQSDKIVLLIDEILNEINAVNVSEDGDADFVINQDLYKSSLISHLRSALKISLGLNTLLVLKNTELQNRLTRVFFSETDNKNEQGSLALEECRLFKKVGLLRGAFVFYPLIQYSEYCYRSDVDLTTSILMLGLFNQDDNTSNVNLSIAKKISKEFIPFRVKFWQVAMLTYYDNLINSKVATNQSEERWFTDKYSNHGILERAFELFYEINRPSIRKSVLKKEYFEQIFSKNAHIVFDDNKERIPKSRKINYYTRNLYLINGGKEKETLRVALINKYVDLKDIFSSLKGYPNVSPDRVEIFDQIWDQVMKVPECDIFVMPELCLPHSLIHFYVEQAARRQIGVVSGIEHLNLFKGGFNFILTVLPININGDRDAIPIIRLKNHYAPEEEDEIIKLRMFVPKPNPYRYDLFTWRGVYFSSYYCFELADVFHRSIFFSKADVIFAPVWNIDTHYYNSLVDSATRDMHNYFVIVNTSQYGFSKIARPRDFVNKEKVILKGGTDDNYHFTIAVGDLKIKELRKFQLLDFAHQKESANPKDPCGKPPFKPTPPDFPKENVQARINNERFRD
jgi:hypothetical protein